MILKQPYNGFDCLLMYEVKYQSSASGRPERPVNKWRPDIPETISKFPMSQRLTNLLIIRRLYV